MLQVGNYWVPFGGDGAARTVVQECVKAEDNTDAKDNFFMVEVPEFDPCAAKQSASLLHATQLRLRSLLDLVNVIFHVIPQISLHRGLLLSFSKTRCCAAPGFPSYSQAAFLAAGAQFPRLRIPSLRSQSRDPKLKIPGRRFKTRDPKPKIPS